MAILSDRDQHWMDRLILFERGQEAIFGRLDVLEAAWEVMIDKIDSLTERYADHQSHDIRAYASMREDILTLRAAVMALEGKDDPAAVTGNQAILDDLPEFETEEEATEYACNELAKGNRSQTIKNWLDELEGDFDE